MTTITQCETPTNRIMKRWILKAGATSLDSLELEEAPIPEPGRGQVRVRINAVSINYRDQLVLGGQYGVLTSDIIPLADGAGRIDGVGEGVTQWAIGDRVTTIYTTEKWADGPPVADLTWGLGAEGQDGVLAEYVVLSANRVAPAPGSLTMVEASTLPCAGLTAWTALKGDRPYYNPIKERDKVLVLGTGGVSLFALLIAQALGAQVIGTSSQNDKLDRLRGLGASDGINYKDVSSWGEWVFTRTGGVAKVVNAAGGLAMEQAIAAVGYGGEIAYMGLFDFADRAPDFVALMSKGASIRGTAVGSSAAHNDLVDFIDRQGIKPPIDQVFRFEDAKAAYEAAASSKLFGKIVIEVAE